MGFEIIAILPLIAGFGFLYWGSQLEEDYNILKLMFQLFFLPLCFLSIHLCIIAVTLLYGSDNATITQLGLFVQILGYVMFLIGLFLLYKIVMEVKDFLLRKKQEKQEEMYG